MSENICFDQNFETNKDALPKIQVDVKVSFSENIKDELYSQIKDAMDCTLHNGYRIHTGYVDKHFLTFKAETFLEASSILNFFLEGLCQEDILKIINIDFRNLEEI